MKKYVDSMKTNTQYRCGECDYEAMKEEDLKKHHGTERQSKEADEPLTTQSKEYECNMCDYQTSDENLLTEHLFREHEKLNYKCYQCKFAGNSSKLLKEHMNEKHGHTKIYECESCDFGFSSKGEYQNHLTRVHNRNKNVRPKNDDAFECDQCTEKCETFQQLVSHKETKHQLVKYVCTVCDYETNVEDNLSKHNTIVHKTKKGKDIDIGPPLTKKPCKFEDPLHSTTCCDRQSGFKQPRLYTRKEKQCEWLTWKRGQHEEYVGSTKCSNSDNPGNKNVQTWKY